MQFQWLEKWAADGLVSQESKDRIYADCYKIIKSAKVENKPSRDEMKSYRKLASLEQSFKLPDLTQRLMTGGVSTKTASAAAPRSHELTATRVGENAAVHFQLAKLALEHIGTEKLANSIGPALTGATFKEMMRNFLLVSSIPLMVGVGVGGVRELMDRKNASDMKKRLEGSYAKAMSASKTDERGILHQNPAAAREAFQALSNFAPHIAAEPMAAKAFMSRIVSYNQGINMEDLRTMTEVERNIGERNGGPGGFVTGFGEGTKSMGFQAGMGDVLKSTYKPFLNATSAKIDKGV